VSGRRTFINRTKEWAVLKTEKNVDAGHARSTEEPWKPRPEMTTSGCPKPPKGVETGEDANPGRDFAHANL
jgi:hypothetical protein